jgi:hypothetical protein
MFAKICDICGRTYEPYGTVIEQEEEMETQDAADIINDDNLADADYDFAATGEEPEINGFRFVTIDEYGSDQYNHELMDTCTTCRDMLLGLRNAIMSHPTPTKITGIDTITFTTEENEG